MVRDRSKFTTTAPNLEVVEADMDDPASLVGPVSDVTHIFLTSPMDDHITTREVAVIDAAKAAGSPHVIDIYGAVRHEGDRLDSMHVAAIDHLKGSGLPWTLVSPNSVMETSLGPYLEQLSMGAWMGVSGYGKVGMVALQDVARVLATVVMSEGHESQNYECTGPVAVDMPQIAATFADVLGKKIEYIDLPEDEFADMMLKHGGYTDRGELEINVLCHLRAWREGKADLVTDTVKQVTATPPMSIRDWVQANKQRFSGKPSMGDRIAGIAMRAQYHKYILAPD